ncbi:hypothetical protein [Rubritalea tangerina]|uniref:hypothetical protein n=1 Tax=Rubritalea tangerina TaxID=430798 RepID=UPI0036116B53
MKWQSFPLRHQKTKRKIPDGGCLAQEPRARAEHSVLRTNEGGYEEGINEQSWRDLLVWHWSLFIFPWGWILLVVSEEFSQRSGHAQVG